MLAVLPIAALGACVVGWRTHAACWPEAVLEGAVTWGVLLVGMTELLSGARVLATAPVALAWLLALAVASGVVVRRRHRLSWRTARPAHAGDCLVLASRHPVEWLVLASLAGVVLILGLLALLTAPNTWDAMTYHLARVVHWQEDATLAPYPTHILRQLYLQPGAELVLLHLLLLSGGDALSGLVQWASMLGSLVGVWLLTLELGGPAVGRAALCAVCVAASLPIGVLESTSTQNDEVVTFWVLCTLVFALRSRRTGSRLTWALFGASLGLALLTKATAYLILLPVVAWLGLGSIARRNWTDARALVLACVLALSLNAGAYARVQTVFGSPLGPPDEGDASLRYLNDALTPSLLASNLVRDLAVNFVATPSPTLNVRALNAVRLVHTWLGAGMADPRTTWDREVLRDLPVAMAFDESYAGNPVHLLLLALALSLVWPLRRRLGSRVGLYAVMVASAWLLFAAVLRWQPWHVRLELPLFIIGAPVIALVSSQLSPRLTLGLCVALVVSMLPWVVNNQARPLIGPTSVLRVARPDQYFLTRPPLRAPYLGAIAVLAQTGCREVGFMSLADGWEFPLYALLPAPVDIRHVNVTNVSADQPAPAFVPCAVVGLGPYADVDVASVQGQLYRRAWRSGSGLEAVAVLQADHERSITYGYLLQ